MLHPLNHLLCFILPTSTSLFLLTGPHSIADALAWTIPFWLILLVDWLGPTARKQPESYWPELFYNTILFALSILQFVNIVLMLAFVAALSWNSFSEAVSSLVNLITLRFLVGTSSGTSAIVVAHELIHRDQLWHRRLGRLLLCTVCYEHFIIAHQRDHHSALGESGDIASARLGESFKAYWRRVYLGYFRYAWQSEIKRLQIESNPYHLQLVKNHVLQGVIIEVSIITLILFYYGWLAALMFLYQALAAVRILEAVNYFQHWGLADGRYGNSFGWVTNSWITQYALIGLSNHIGHHQDESQPYYKISFSDQGPILPYGYFVMNLWIKLNNASFQKMALNQLKAFQHAQSQQAIFLASSR